MNQSNDKERISKIDKIVRFFESIGKKHKRCTIDEYRNTDTCHLKQQTEEEYRDEQAKWLASIHEKRKDKQKNRLP